MTLHAPTPLTKLNELVEASIDATFATFETRRVNWSDQLELQCVSPKSPKSPGSARGARTRGASSRPGTAFSFDSEYRGSSAYSLSNYDDPPPSPRAPDGAPKSANLDSPNKRKRPFRTNLAAALAVDPAKLEPVKTLSRHRKVVT